jgi:hypothetical protein
VTIFGRDGRTPRNAAAAVVDHDAVHGHLELAVAAANHVYVGLKLTAKARRHTGGVDAGDSKRAALDPNTCHQKSSTKAEAARPD